MKMIPVLMIILTALAVRVRAADSYFVPPVKIAGVSADRSTLWRDENMLAQRTGRMFSAMTWAIMRNPKVLENAQRVTDEKLSKIFKNASTEPGVITAGMLQAISFVESGGDEDAVSPTGPVGPMQISRAKGIDLGIYATKKVKKKVFISKKVRGGKRGKPRVIQVSKTITVEEVIRDDRRVPEVAIPAAWKNLEVMARILGGTDFAIAAWHGGEKRVLRWISLASGTTATEANAANLVNKNKLTVARIFFGCSPVSKRALYLQLKKDLESDYSPTYWFRVIRGEQLLAVYRIDKDEFKKLAHENQNKANDKIMAPSRFWSWLTREEFMYDNRDDIRKAVKKGELVVVPNSPRTFGFKLRVQGRGSIGEMDFPNQELYLYATTDVRGAIMYIAYELRRLAGRETFNFEITSLVRDKEYQGKLKSRGGNVNASTAFPTHLSGKVFDITYAKLNRRQKEFLEFILQDLEWADVLSFVEEGHAQRTFHVVPAPSARHFFSQVY